MKTKDWHVRFVPGYVEISRVMDENKDSEWIETGEICVEIMDKYFPYDISPVETKYFDAKNLESVVEYSTELSTRYDIPIHFGYEKNDTESA